MSFTKGEWKLLIEKAFSLLEKDVAENPRLYNLHHPSDFLEKVIKTKTKTMAAPQLLEACKAGLGYLETSPDDYNSPSAEQMRAAIEAAESQP